MPRKIKDVTRNYLENIPLPAHGQSYTVISHKSIIDYANQELANQGFGILNEEYRSSIDGQIAQGIYRLQYGTDPEMNVMFAWTNSYNKQIRFKCATGGYVNSNQTVMLAGELGSYARKHTGTADADVIASMQSQIVNATMYYNQLVSDKEVMKTITLSTRKQAELLGILFAEYEVLTTEQASIIRQQMDKPSYFYNGGKHTLWAFYNHVTVALQQSHPRTWMEDQRMLHWVISNEFDLTATAPDLTPDEELSVPAIDPLYMIPNQTNLLDQIAEVTEDNSVLEPQNVLTEDELAHQLYGVDNDIEVSIHPTEKEIQDSIDEIVVQYTDPVGNTFEAQVVGVTFTEELTEAISEKFEAEAEELVWNVPSLEPTPEEYEIFEEEERVSFDTINLNESTKVAVVVETKNDDFDLSFDLDQNTDNDLYL